MQVPDGKRWLAACALMVAFAVQGAPAGRRRALLIGINDYSGPAGTNVRGVSDREWADLRGAVRDAEGLREILVRRYEFAESDIEMLTDRKATRSAILAALARLATQAHAGDTVVFHFSGHGSQVKNSHSDEPDRMDESIVPADSRLGVPDIRDKELGKHFNRILDRGARLTVILDSCHSGSGVRGLATGETARGIKADLRDVKDASAAGRRPEDRGALVLSAAEDLGLALETVDEEGKDRGAFSWAWMHAMRAAEPDEPAMETFFRARARLGVMSRHQRPILAGNTGARQRPFPGVQSGRPLSRTTMAVEALRDDGTVVLQGGWLNGLTIGSELRPLGREASRVRLEVTALTGLVRAEGRVVGGDITPGSLVQLVSWAAPPGRPLRVWLPRTAMSAAELTRLAQAVAEDAARRGIRWIADPTVTTPTHLLRWNGRTWELLSAKTATRRTASEAGAALPLVSRNASLFVQWPVPDALGQRLVGDAATRRLRTSEARGQAPEAAVPIVTVDRAEEADYILAGRFDQAALGYAWVRPLSTAADRAESALPVRSEWEKPDVPRAVFALAKTVERLQRVLAWQLLESPPGTAYEYRLAVRRARDRELLTKQIEGGDSYGIALRIRPGQTSSAASRYVYIFLVDSFGRSTLLYPRNGSVENFFPLPHGAAQGGTRPPAEIALGSPQAFTAVEPYGADTYFLLTTDEPLGDPWILEWDGARPRQSGGKTPLEQLLVNVGAPDRSARRFRTAANWSIERMVIESMPPLERRTSP